MSAYLIYKQQLLDEKELELAAAIERAEALERLCQELERQIKVIKEDERG